MFSQWWISLTRTHSVTGQGDKPNQYQQRGEVHHVTFSFNENLTVHVCSWMSNNSSQHLI